MINPEIFSSLRPIEMYNPQPGSGHNGKKDGSPKGTKDSKGDKSSKENKGRKK